MKLYQIEGHLMKEVFEIYELEYDCFESDDREGCKYFNKLYNEKMDELLKVAKKLGKKSVYYNY